MREAPFRSTRAAKAVREATERRDAEMLRERLEFRVPLEFHRWRRKELAVVQVRRSNHEATTARDLLARHSFTLERVYGFDCFSFLIPRPERFQFSDRIGWVERAVMALNR